MFEEIERPILYMVLDSTTGEIMRFTSVTNELLRRIADDPNLELFARYDKYIVEAMIKL